MIARFHCYGSLGLALLLSGSLGAAAHAAAPELIHTPGYESPVHADPDDLLMIAGNGFDPTDQVVYLALDQVSAVRDRPAVVPRHNDALSGTVPIVQRGSPTYAITVRLPQSMQKGRAYRLWVVTRSNEWSVPLTLNDPRPQWVSPSVVYSTLDFAQLGRRLRVIGHNLTGDSSSPLQIRLSGPGTYLLESLAPQGAAALHGSVAEALLPARLTPGTYWVSVRRPGLAWADLPDQRLTVRPDPKELPSFSPADPRYGGCRPDTDADDSACFARVLAAAAQAGGGTVLVPPGAWNLSTAGLTGPAATDGLIVGLHVRLQGSGAAASRIVRHGLPGARRPDALFTLLGDNSVAAIGFADAVTFESPQQSRPVLQLGRSVESSPPDPATGSVSDIIITDNSFHHVGRAITDDAGHPLERLYLMRNDFGAYSESINLPGAPTRLAEPFAIDDAIVRFNRIVPGSYLDLTAHQGVIASGMGAAHHVDFSSNLVDGASAQGLQRPTDPKGFRAGLFWNLTSNVELLLIAENRILCSGDKDGDGEAIAFDDSANTRAFLGTVPVSAAGSNWVKVQGVPAAQQFGRDVPLKSYYRDHWLTILAGPGLGQTRRIIDYSIDPASSTVTFQVAPAWDIVPVPEVARIVVARQFWQVQVIGNDIEHRSPPCQKSNLTAPKGGVIVIWGPSADVTVADNRQRDTDGILFASVYQFATAAFPHDGNATFLQTALEIRGNLIEGEYDSSTDCSQSGIWSSFGATPNPGSPPPVVGFGIAISHNTVVHADARDGGGIDMPPSPVPGPPPGRWAFIENLLVFHNQLSDLSGAPPRAKCFTAQRGRIGIHLGGTYNVRDSVLYRNRCERVDIPLADEGQHTTRLCPAPAQRSATRGTDCECP